MNRASSKVGTSTRITKIARRILTTVLVSLLSAYLAALAFLWINQRNIVFHPDPTKPFLPVEAEDSGFRVIRITGTDGLMLSPWYAPAQPGGKTIVYFQGNAGHLGYRLENVLPYVEAGHGILLAAYRGYGGNPGAPSEAGLYSDGRAQLDWLARQGVAEGDLILFGESLGAAIALQMAIERRSSGLVMEAPFASILASARARFPLFAFDWLIRDKFASADKIGALRAPLLVIHGARDQVTPIRFGRQVFAAAPEPKFALWVPDAGHGDLMNHGLPERVLEFLRWIGERRAFSR